MSITPNKTKILCTCYVLEAVLSAGFTEVNKKDVVPLCIECSLVAGNGTKSLHDISLLIL